MKLIILLSVTTLLVKCLEIDVPKIQGIQQNYQFAIHSFHIIFVIKDTPQSWSQWSCVGGTWTRTRSVTQQVRVLHVYPRSMILSRGQTTQDGRCYGEDRTHCTPGPCEERGECCRDNSVCNVAVRAGGWITCTCLGRFHSCSVEYNC